MNKIILFDLDGTLIDSTDAILESFGVAFDTFGTPRPSHQAIKAQIGHPLDAMFAALGVEEAKVWDYVTAYKQHYRSIFQAQTTLLPDAMEAIRLAKSVATLGVVTTKTAQYSKELLEQMGVMGYFDVLIGREDVEHPKPHREPIDKALLALPKRVESVWMIGDTCMDMLSAKHANVSSVAVSCGYGSLEDLAACTEHICANAYEAVEFILTQ